VIDEKKKTAVYVTPIVESLLMDLKAKAGLSASAAAVLGVLMLYATFAGVLAGDRKATLRIIRQHFLEYLEHLENVDSGT